MSRAASASRTIWLHVVVPLTVLTLYLVSLWLFYLWLLPESIRGVNAVFVERAWRYVLVAAGISLLTFFMVFRKARWKGLQLRDRSEKISAVDLILVLLPLTAVVQYIINNQDVLSPSGSLYVLAVFTVFSVLLSVVIPALLGVVGSAKTLMLMGVTLAFMITNMASFSARYAWFQEGSLIVQLAIFSAIFIVGRLLYSNQVGRKFLYFMAATFFLTGVVLQFAPGDQSGTAPSNLDRSNKLLQLVDSREPLSKPNIYLLIYDAYVANETMLEYGIDNSAQEKFLEAVGFKLYPHTYSVSAFTVPTMSRVLDASHELHGPPRRGISGDGVIHNLLKSFGYETHAIFQSGYAFQGIGSSYDFSFPKVKADVASAHRLLMREILMGDFRADVDVEFEAPSFEKFKKTKASTFKKLSQRPRFLYVHLMLPNHSQNSGDCLPDETQLFKERLALANNHMKKDVETLIQNDPGAIIIVAGDHGPYLTKNCVSTGKHYDISEISRLDIQDRFGTFLAIKWPTEGFLQYDDITVLQDVFPVVFAYLFDDGTFLDAKVEPNTVSLKSISGAQVKYGIIHGGINDGEPLFLSGGHPSRD
jgi:hypothetical protein